jgi:hypothetical protein
LTDCSLYFGRRIWFIDDDEVLDGFVALIGNTFFARSTLALPVVGVTTVTRGSALI